MTSVLEKMLETGNWKAVEEAKRQGPGALPLLRRFIQHQNYRSRQIAMACAGAIGADEGADVLVAGLKDSNVNVHVAAANELAVMGYPSATEAVLEQMMRHRDEYVRERLALAAGYLPGHKTVAVLRSIAKDNGQLGINARLALAKLGDPEARRWLTDRLSSSTPRTRYDALGEVRYLNNQQFVDIAKRMLVDRAEAVRIGPILAAPRYRRVCDQAIDTLVLLLQLKVPFEVTVEKIYTDQELEQLKQLVSA